MAVLDGRVLSNEAGDGMRRGEIRSSGRLMMTKLVEEKFMALRQQQKREKDKKKNPQHKQDQAEAGRTS